MTAPLAPDDVDAVLKLAGEARPLAEDMLRRHLAALDVEFDTEQERRLKAERELRDLQQHVSDLEKSLEQARKERDDALVVCAAVSARFGFTGPIDRLPEAAESVVDLGRKTLAEYQRAERERDAALADNAALVRFLTSTPTDECLWCDWNEPAHDQGCGVADLLAQPHPGAALLERVKRLEAQSISARQEGRDAGLESLAAWADNRPRGCTNRDCKACTEDRIIAGMARAMKGGKTPEEALADLH